LLRPPGRNGAKEGRLLLASTPHAEGRRGTPWPSIVGLSIDQLVAWGVLYYAFNVLSGPMATDLGVSRRFLAGSFSLALLVSGVIAGTVGRALDRLGARVILLAGTIVGGLSFGALAFVHHGAAIVLAFVALGIAHSLSLYEPAFRAIVGWVDEAPMRSRAMLVLTSIAGFASTAFLPLAAFWVDRFGWRTAVLLLAGSFCAVVIPLRLSMPGTESHAAARTSSVVSTPSRAADLLGLAFAMQSFASTGVVVFLVAHLLESGSALGIAAALAGLLGAAQVPGRLVLLPLQRALPPAHRLPMLFALQALGLIGIAHLDGIARMASILLFGGTAGMMTLERATITVSWFGAGTFGARSGRMSAMAAVARAASPFAVELLHGRMTYAHTFVAMASGFVAAGAAGVAASSARRAEALES
jgi:MFS family permease